MELPAKKARSTALQLAQQELKEVQLDFEDSSKTAMIGASLDPK